MISYTEQKIKHKEAIKKSRNIYYIPYLKHNYLSISHPLRESLEMNKTVGKYFFYSKCSNFLGEIIILI